MFWNKHSTIWLQNVSFIGFFYLTSESYVLRWVANHPSSQHSSTKLKDVSHNFLHNSQAFKDDQIKSLIYVIKNLRIYV